MSDLQSAADAAVLHPDHGLVRLYQRRVVDQTLVDVELGHVVHDDGALEVLLVVLGLEDVLQQGGFPGAQEPAEQRDGHKGIFLNERKKIMSGNNGQHSTTPMYRVSHNTVSTMFLLFSWVQEHIQSNC